MDCMGMAQMHLLDDYTTGENNVKYLYTMALRIEEPTAVKRVQEPQKPGISPQYLTLCSCCRLAISTGPIFLFAALMS